MSDLAMRQVRLRHFQNLGPLPCAMPASDQDAKRAKRERCRQSKRSTVSEDHGANHSRISWLGSVKHRPDKLRCACTGCQTENQPEERGRIPRNKISRSIRARCAPRATRMPISDTRRVTDGEHFIHAYCG